MSANKNKYFEVTVSKIVQAPNKTEAIAMAKRLRGGDTYVEQISAATAKSLAATA